MNSWRDHVIIWKLSYSNKYYDTISYNNIVWWLIKGPPEEINNYAPKKEKKITTIKNGLYGIHQELVLDY